MEGKYINDNSHKKGKKFFIRLGIVMIVVAIALIIGGAVLIAQGVQLDSSVGMGDDNWFDVSSKASGMIFGGSALLMFGFFIGVCSIVAFVSAYRREILAFQASTVAPVVKETAEFVADDLSPSINKTVGGLAESISVGVAEGVAKAKSAKISSEYKCAECGETNEKNSKFCSNCGAKLRKEYKCSHCGAELKSKDKFCPVCGEKVEKQ
ncbi:MAG: zinc ribbon domain-containing protein [Candidatus Caccovivens sp.]